DAPGPNCALARFYVTAPPEFRSPEKALQLALKAVATHPGDYDQLNTLGLVYYRSGRYRQAAEAFEQGVTADSDGMPLSDLLFLAMCYHHLGDRARAEAYYQKAVKPLEDSRVWSSFAEMEELASVRAEAEAMLGKEGQK